MSRYTVVYERTADGWGASVPDLPGLGVLGDTLEETRDLIREGIKFHLEGMKKSGQKLPEQSVFTEELELEISA